MPQEAVAPAESTPAAAVAVEEKPILETLTGEQYQEWKSTGKLPEPPKREASAPSQRSSAAAPAETTVEAGSQAENAAPASEAGTKAPEKPVKNAETRVKELLAERAAERERANRAEARLRELESGKPGDKPADSPSAKAPEPTRAKPTPEDKKDDGSPKYASYEEYLEDVADWKAEQRVAQYKADEAAAEEKRKADEQKAEQERKAKETRESFEKRVGEAKKKHADYEAKVFSEDSPVAQIPPGSAMDFFILRSPHGPELLYHLATTDGEVARIAALDGVDQVAELAVLAHTLTGGKSPDKKATQTLLPNPPAEVGGRSTAPADPLQAAVQAGDFSAYKRLQDAQDLKKS